MFSATSWETYKNIIHDLTFFFNLCLKSAVFPTNLKIAIITPIYKSGKRDRFDNYRPISISPILSKILENKLFILYCRVIWTTTTFYIRCSLVSEKNHSMYMPIVHIYDEITINLQNIVKLLAFT